MDLNVADEPSWDDIFRPRDDTAAKPAAQAQPAWQPPGPTAEERAAAQALPATALLPSYPSTAAEQAAEAAPSEPLPSRRELRESESRRGARGVGPRGGGRGDAPKRRRRRWPWVLLGVLVVLAGLVGGAAWYGWTNYEPQIREVMGWELPSDYTTAGNGDEVVVVIQSGDIGLDVAQTLTNEGVTMTFDAFYDLLLENPDVSFEPGNYRLQEQMSASSALAALQDPANKVVNQVTVPEGTAAVDAYVLLASATGLPEEDFVAAGADFEQFGIPGSAPDIEGWLYPATYTFDPGVTAADVLQQMVDRMVEELDTLGVPEGDREETLILASIVQRESGGTDDMPKIARVFLNRIDEGMRLQSDATVAYGTGNTHTVWTTDAEREDAGNPYNTYANDGLPVGPVGLPGTAAIASVIDPADGDWLYFVPTNLKTGKTAFAETADEHQANVDKLLAWCAESAENDSYCQ
jgi:UPF0755 protein